MKSSPLKLKKHKKEVEYEIDKAIENIIFLNKYIKKNHFLYEIKKEILNLNNNKGIIKYFKDLYIKINKLEKKIINEYLRKNSAEINDFNKIVQNKESFENTYDINDLIKNIEIIAKSSIKLICEDLKKNYSIDQQVFYKYIADYANYTHDREKKEAIGIIIKNITEIIK